MSVVGGIAGVVTVDVIGEQVVGTTIVEPEIVVGDTVAGLINGPNILNKLICTDGRSEVELLLDHGEHKRAEIRGRPHNT